MSQHAIEELAQLPLMENEDAQIYSQIICWVLDSMILSHAHVLGYYTVKVVNMSLEYGLNEYVPNAFVFNALIQCSQKNYEVAYEFASLSVKLNEDRFNTGGLKCKIRHINSFTRNLREPMTNTHFLDTFKIGLETGDNVYASFACGVAVRYSFPQGIQEVYAAANIAIPFLKKINNAAILIHVELVVGMAKCLEGKTKHSLSFDDVDDPQGIRQRNEDVFGEGRSPMMWSFIASYELQLFVLFEAYAKGLPYIRDRVKIVDESGTGATDLQFRSEYFFYSGVILANLYADASPEEQIEYMQILEECLEELRLLANSCKHNFYHLLQGLAAEKARIMGDAMAAMDLYDEAINYAQQSEFMKDEALLSELAGRFWLSKNKDNFAEVYLRRAYQLYKNWGATAKVKDLDTKYPSYVYQGYQKSSTKSTTSMSQGKSTVGLNSGSGGSVLDLDSILRASQALSQEVKIDALLAKMLHIVIENTGAQSGYLIDHAEGNLWIRVQGDVNAAETITPATPIDTGDHLPVSLVHLATRGKQTLVIDNASEHPQYAQDQYIVQHQTKSVLCYPVLRQGEVSLLFYLENNLVTGAFTSERLEVLNTLSSQMAISVENALLYENLEQKVQERTNELNQALKDVKFTNAQIMDSIYYARRIQNTILIAQAQLKAAFADHFVLYLPKDVVSGDFYWMSQTPQYKMIAVVDCTGHGVPGAFMSIIGNGLLNEIINDKQVYDPAEVLQLLDSGVRKTLKQDENSNADGMDLCLCRIAYSENSDEVNITFAGAKRPLFYGKQQQLEEIAGDRISISGWRGKQTKNFSNHQVSLSKDDVLYLSTDGYADMPNPRRRNFTHRRLKELLAEILALPMAEQRERLLQTLQDYQQDARQRDDITLLGIRL
jgi:serine phosphatase RsbU (regulator of sigma subunit)